MKEEEGQSYSPVVLVDLVVVVSAAELSEVDVVSSLLVEEAAVELEALELLTCDEIELETALETDDAIAEDCDEPRPVVELDAPKVSNGSKLPNSGSWQRKTSANATR